jgi:4-nitrophenyl phosphatase
LPPDRNQAPGAGDRLYQASAFLLDLDGTVFLGDRLLPGAAHFLETLDRQGKDYLFLTNNSSKDRSLYAYKLAGLGLPIPDWRIFTSGEATALYLQSELPAARLYVVGTPSLESEFNSHGFTLTAEDPQAVVLGYDTTLTYAKMARLCSLVRAGLPYYATHPDLNCPSETGPLPDIGCTIAYVATSTGRSPDKVFGKPTREMAAMAARRLGLPLNHLAIAGDRLYTDIAMGMASEIPTLLVLSGETRQADLADALYRPDYVFNHLGEAADWMLACAQTPSS